MTGATAIFERGVARLSLWGGYAAAGSVLAIAALICVEVIGRALFNASTMIADEMSGYLNCAVVFLGLAYSFREGGFIRVEVLYNRLGGTPKRAVQWLICLTSLVYMVVVAAYMGRHVVYSYQRGVFSTQVSETPLFIPQSLILAGSVLMALQLLAYLVGRLRQMP